MNALTLDPHQLAITPHEESLKRLLALKLSHPLGAF